MGTKKGQVRKTARRAYSPKAERAKLFLATKRRYDKEIRKKGLSKVDFGFIDQAEKMFPTLAEWRRK